MHRLWLLLLIVGLVLSITGCGGDGPPKPGAVLTGPIESSENATGGTMTLTVSDDGASITRAKVTLTGVKCRDFPPRSPTTDIRSDFPVTKGNIAISLPRGDQIKGRFTSPTEASGTIDFAPYWYHGGQPCELGKWSAKAD